MAAIFWMGLRAANKFAKGVKMERIRELAQQEIDLEAGDIEELANTAAITNEVVTIEQKILPIIRKNRMIGVVIMEQDISMQVIRERTVELFQQTAEELGETLWEVAVAETNLSSLIHEGVILSNSELLFTYLTSSPA